jgi:hypothetical protein
MVEEAERLERSEEERVKAEVIEALVSVQGVLPASIPSDWGRRGCRWAHQASELVIVGRWPAMRSPAQTHYPPPWCFCLD